MFANVLCCFSFLGKLARNGWVWSRWAPKIQIGQLWIPIPLVTGNFFVYLMYSFLLETSFHSKMVRCRLAAVLASGMGASLLGG